MIKNEPHKESICFNFGKDEQKKDFFDKAKRCDIIHNNNSVFLHKILSVKNQSLLDYTLKHNQSQSLNNLNSSSDTKINSNTASRKNHRTLTTSLKQSPISNLLVDLNYNSPQNSSNLNLLFSPKIMVNKNKNLGNISLKEKDKDKDKDRICLNTTFFNKCSSSNCRIKEKINNEERPSFKSETSVNPEISFSNLYTNKYLRKPVVIKFNNGFKPDIVNNSINSNDNSNSNNLLNDNNDKNEQKINFPLLSHEKEKDENKERRSCLQRVKTDERIKPYNFYEKTQSKSELYRSFEDLERKSIEIKNRKMKKKSEDKISIPNFKKDTNLIDLKESLDNYRKSKSKKKQRTEVKKSSTNNNRNLKNIQIKRKNKENSTNSFRMNPKEKNDFRIVKKGKIKYTNGWQEQRNAYIKKEQDFKNSKNKTEQIVKNINYKNISNMKSEKVLKEEEKKESSKNFFIKKKNININFIEDNKNENIYNINLNSTELINKYNHSLSYNHSFVNKNEKKTFIRNKYSKKNNKNIDEFKTHNKGSKKSSHRGNKTPHVTKKFIEDYKINDSNDNISVLSYSQSQSYLSYNALGKQIKVNKKNHSPSKRESKSNKKNLPSILEEEEKIKNEIKNNLNILNAVESLEEIIKVKKEYNIREAFKSIVDFYNQIKSFNYSTLQTNMSQISGIKYVKKIIPLEKQFSKENVAKSDKYFSRKSATRNSIYVERQKLILQKRKEFGFFERYENCKDFIDNFRMYLIKFLLKQRNKEV